MILLGQPNTLGCDRLGIIASRKFGGAVARNRAKRRLRELFRRQSPRRPPPAAIARSILLRFRGVIS
jgi:ribonuclease P protein component